MAELRERRLERLRKRKESRRQEKKQSRASMGTRAGTYEAPIAERQPAERATKKKRVSFTD